MIKPEEMKPGLVLRDPQHSPDSPTRQFFRILPDEGEGGPWTAVHVASGAETIFRDSDLARLEANAVRVFCDVDFSALIGERVRCDLKFGSQVTGTIQEVRTLEIEILGEQTTVPVKLMIDGQEYPLDQIKAVHHD